MRKKDLPIFRVIPEIVASLKRRISVVIVKAVSGSETEALDQALTAQSEMSSFEAEES